MDWKSDSAALAALFIGVGIRLLLLYLPAQFMTDVYYYDSQGAAYLIHGVNPYGQAYAVPPSLATPGAGSVFAYLPGIFAFIVPAWAVWDPRLGLVISDLIIAVCILLLRTGRARFYSGVYILLPPTILFSTSFINDGLPAIAFIASAVLMERRKMPVPAAILWGLALASSQEAWLVFPFYAYYSLRSRNYRRPMISIGAAAAVVLPFLLWNPTAFIYDTVFFQFTRQASAFISTGPFGLNVNPSLEGVLLSFGITIPLAIRGVIFALAFLLTLWKAGRTLPSCILSAAIFSSVGLFLVAGDLYWSYLELPFVLFVVWGALKGDNGS